MLNFTWRDATKCLMRPCGLLFAGTKYQGARNRDFDSAIFRVNHSSVASEESTN